MTLLHGFALTLLGGLSVGFSAWSLKWARIWKFENYWLFNCIVSLIILPFSLAYWLLPHLGSVYASLGAREVLKPFLFGALWGIALLGAGVCMHKLGFAVSGAVVNGTGAAVGTLAPLILLHRAMMFESNGLLILVGTMIMLAGVALCGWSGYHREEEAKRQGRGAGFSPKESDIGQEVDAGPGCRLGGVSAHAGRVVDFVVQKQVLSCGEHMGNVGNDFRTLAHQRVGSRALSGGLQLAGEHD